MNVVTKPTAAQDSVWLDRLHQIVSAPASEPQKKSEPDRKAPHGPLSRRAALAALVGGGAAAGVLATPNTASAQVPQKVNDASAFTQILVHETTHAKFLAALLGPNARPMPTLRNLEMPNFTQFARIAQIFENLGAGAYLGAAPFINDRVLLARAGSIGAIEARQAGWLNNALGNVIAGSAYNPALDRSFEDPLTPEQVAAASSYFIANLNGGPPMTYLPQVSAVNDIAILNFALAQELLEAQFYYINVLKFFVNGKPR